MDSTFKVLALLPDTRLPDNSRLYEELGKLLDLTVMKMSHDARRNLQPFLSEVDLTRFDRVVLELRFKHAFPQMDYLRTLPQLVLIEDDTWQNYVCFGRNQGMFSRYYDALKPKRVINSGHAVAMALRAQGYDGVFLGKGFDGTQLNNLERERDIDIAFIGRVEHDNYAPRRQLLLSLKERIGLPLLRTSTVAEYREMLNRIRYFVSADVHFGEHMIKNFEAMACGCVLVAFAQGLDDTHLGLQDGYNCLLYRHEDELLEKISRLREDPARATEIARRGEKLAHQNHEYTVLAKKYAGLLEAPLP